MGGHPCNAKKFAGEGEDSGNYNQVSLERMKNEQTKKDKKNGCCQLTLSTKSGSITKYQLISIPSNFSERRARKESINVGSTPIKILSRKNLSVEE